MFLFEYSLDTFSCILAPNLPLFLCLHLRVYSLPYTRRMNAWVYWTTIIIIDLAMQSSTSIVLALAFLVGNAAAYGGSFMGSRAALSSGRAAAGRANTRMEVR